MRVLLSIRFHPATSYDAGSARMLPAASRAEHDLRTWFSWRLTRPFPRRKPTFVRSENRHRRFAGSGRHDEPARSAGVGCPA